jgi:hypothetical protein
VPKSVSKRTGRLLTFGLLASASASAIVLYNWSSGFLSSTRQLWIANKFETPDETPGIRKMENGSWVLADDENKRLKILG